MTRILFAAIIAGIAAGLCVSALQQVRTVPLILAAEEFEGSGGHAHEHGARAPQGAQSQGHDHAEGAWTPQDGLQRTVFTVLTNILTGTAFSLLLAGLIILTGSGISVAQGAIWGAAGFAAFVLAPSFGLAPELPGMPAADLVARQGWWLMTALLTGAGLGLLLLQSRAPLMVLGLLLIAAPHVIGAPQPAEHASNVPAALAASFATASIVTAAVFWLVLGCALGFVLSRESRQAT